MILKLDVSKKRVISIAERTLFGSFVEHMGRVIYGGIYDPQNKTADEQGFRNDVIDKVKDLNIGIVRYPGGNFVSNYNWKDGIGPIENRPKKIDVAWKQLEPNIIGTDEFYDWSQKTDVEIMMAVNMGTGTPKEACELVEYCNSDADSYWANERRKNGHKDPLNIKYWCIGNEMDGKWQMGSLSAEDYAIKARETIKLMKSVDPTIKVVVCGSSSPFSNTFPEWERKVLEENYPCVDYLSLHYYAYNLKHSTPDYMQNPVDLPDKDFLASASELSGFIKNACTAIDYVKALKRGRKDIKIALDEWNVWYREDGECSKERWQVGAERLENVYSFKDALVDASMLSVIINNSDRIKIACQAQLLNVIGLMLTKDGKEVLKQSIYYPFELMANKYAGKEILNPIGDIPTYISDEFGIVPSIYTSICYDKEKGEYVITLINVNDEDCNTSLVFDTNVVMIEWKEMKTDLNQKNTFEEPYNVIFNDQKINTVNSTNQEINIKGYSISVITYKEII